LLGRTECASLYFCDGVAFITASIYLRRKKTTLRWRRPVASLGSDELLVIEYLMLGGADGWPANTRDVSSMALPTRLHLAISADCKVHCATSGMAHNAVYRSEERRLLENMPAALVPRAMAALAQICATLELDYGGMISRSRRNGSVLLFEANATMIVFPPSPDSMWDYRRRAIRDVFGRSNPDAAAPRHSGCDLCA